MGEEKWDCERKKEANWNDSPNWFAIKHHTESKVHVADVVKNSTVKEHWENKAMELNKGDPMKER